MIDKSDLKTTIKPSLSAIANDILQESSLTTQVQVILIKPAAPIPDFDGNIRIELTRSKSNL